MDRFGLLGVPYARRGNSDVVGLRGQERIISIRRHYTFFSFFNRVTSQGLSILFADKTRSVTGRSLINRFRHLNRLAGRDGHTHRNVQLRGHGSFLFEMFLSDYVRYDTSFK